MELLFTAGPGEIPLILPIIGCLLGVIGVPVAIAIHRIKGD